MWEILRSARYAARGLIRTPIFTITVSLTLALVIGANSTVFSIIDRVLLRSLPFPQADQLIYVTHIKETSGVRVNIAPIRLRDWSQRNTGFEAIAAYYSEDVTDTTGQQPENLRRAVVSPGFLGVWGIQPALGRNFVAEEHGVGGPTGVLISNEYWRERANFAPDVLGRTLIIEGQPVEVIGVMPPEFSLVAGNVDLWSPLKVDAPTTTSRRNAWFSGVVGRLRPGISPMMAQRDLQAVQAQLARDYPETDSDLAVTAMPYRDVLVGPVRSSLWVLYTAVSVLVLIACTNIAALLLARATQRGRNIAIRFLLGAPRGRIATHVLFETALLVLAGTVGGLAFAWGAAAVLGSYTSDLPNLGGINPDARVFAYTLATAASVVLLCGLFPAVKSARPSSLSTAGRTQVGSRHSLDWTLVGVQVALSVMLLAGAALSLRSFDSLAKTDMGFDGAQVLTFRVSGNLGEARDFLRVFQRIERTIDGLDSLPGVEAVATSSILPGVSGSNETSFKFADWTPPGDVPVVAENRMVSPSYLETLQIPLLAGDLCRRPDAPTAPREAMVNRAFVERYFGTSPVLGHQVASQPPTRIVGVVGNAREIATHLDAPPTVYTCYSAPSPIPWFLVRTAGDPTDIVESVRAKLADLEPQRSVYNVALLTRRASDLYARDRLRTALLTIFSVTALSLACLGVYGTLNYIVSLRRREIGLRVAVGALPRAIVARYLGKALKVVGLAGIVGLGLSAALARFMSSMLYNISLSDPLTLATLASVVGFALLVATLAALVPATRASRVDPVDALRDE